MDEIVEALFKLTLALEKEGSDPNPILKIVITHRAKNALAFAMFRVSQSSLFKQDIGVKGDVKFSILGIEFETREPF